MGEECGVLSASRSYSVKGKTKWPTARKLIILQRRQGIVTEEEGGCENQLYQIQGGKIIQTINQNNSLIQNNTLTKYRIACAFENEEYGVRAQETYHCSSFMITPGSILLSYLPLPSNSVCQGLDSFPCGEIEGCYLYPSYSAPGTLCRASYLSSCLCADG